ncbi:MAG: MotA/TolQ/ExbB proton channel family protein [Rhodospirillales bacterium]|nr:MotA/TolQ/ExbB proton channel family protein [Alphaproteobacteria bacterium]MBL6947917.1 MotA/TolQ/ExbB proton channel family protein [Rhodospirillales bacterium]
MDIATLLGLVIGVTVVTLAIMTGSGGDMSIFLNLPGFLIVCGGTFASTLIKFPIAGVFVAFFVGTKAAFVNEKETPREIVDLTMRLVKRARKVGLLGLEKISVRNNFFRKGVQLCADGREADVIRKMMTREMELAIQRQEVGEKVFRAIGESAPAFGMVGTLVGLVQMLSTMEDPTAIGRAMAVALLTTLYGVLIAQLIALPISDKLEAKNEIERANRVLIIEAIVQIHERNNPTAVLDILEAYLPEKQRGRRDGDAKQPGGGDARNRRATDRA